MKKEYPSISEQLRRLVTIHKDRFAHCDTTGQKLITIKLNGSEVPVVQDIFIIYLQYKASMFYAKYPNGSRQALMAYLDRQQKLSIHIKSILELSDAQFNDMIDEQPFLDLNRAWVTIFHPEYIKNTGERYNNPKQIHDVKQTLLFENRDLREEFLIKKIKEWISNVTTRDKKNVIKLGEFRTWFNASGLNRSGFGRLLGDNRTAYMLQFKCRDANKFVVNLLEDRFNVLVDVSDY